MSKHTPPRPDTLDVNPEGIPEGLTQRDQWVCWQYKWQSGREEWTKVPVDATTGYNAKSSDKDTWTSYATALEYHHTNDTDGLGFMLDESDTVLGLDLDDCRDADTGELEPWAAHLLIDVDTYAEVSPSGTGLHLLGHAILPDGGNRGDVDNGEGHLEMYDSGRYFTVTGQRVDDTPADVCQVNDAVSEVHAEHIADHNDGESGHNGGVEHGSDGSKPTPNVDKPTGSPGSDADIIQKGRDEDTAKFAQLWRGLTGGYSSHSEADLALCQKLTFYTQDRKQIDRIFRQSGLYRDKWDDEHHANGDTYGEGTIKKALENQTEYYDWPGTVDNNNADNSGDNGNGDGEGHSWENIRERLTAASGADDRAKPRYDAAMKLKHAEEFLNLDENDQLYVYDDATGVYSDRGEAVVRERLTDRLKDQYRAHGMRLTLDHIRGRETIRQDEIGGPAGLVAAENCVIDLTGDELQTEPHSPEYRFLSQVKCEYDPAATAPRFEEFLRDIVPNGTDRKKLQEYAGYCLHHWGQPHHKALFVVGPTASGKSTFLDTITAMMGDETVASLTPQQLTTERFSGAELFKKWANVRNDIPAATVKNTGQFKEIIGGDSIKAERKRKDPFMFQPQAAHMYAANELPSIDTDDDAFYRRVLLVAVPKTVPAHKRDKQLDDKLQSELSGVLNWALEGLQRLSENGSFTGDRGLGQTRDTWAKWSDSVSRFKSVAISDGHSDVSKSKLYAGYLEYCRQEGIPTESQHKFTTALKESGLTDGRSYINGDRKRVFHNIELTTRGEELIDAARDGANDDNHTGSGLSDYGED
jgi:P4 family phage/plasmid primase-like protien